MNLGMTKVKYWIFTFGPREPSSTKQLNYPKTEKKDYII